MLLVIDVGNSNTVIGCYDKDVLEFVARISTDSGRTSDEYAVLIKNIMRLRGIKRDHIKGVAISSVVPALLQIMKKTVMLIKTVPMVCVEPGVKTGLNIKIDNPAQLGSDLVCVSVAVLKKYDIPSMVFDMGTATTISAIDENRFFLGGSILPGVGISLEALSLKTAQLPHISLEGEEPPIIGTNTIDSMRSGVILGAASMIDGMVERYKACLGETLTVVATGGISGEIVKYCKSNVIYDENLLLEGLKLIYEKNVK